MTQRKNFSDFRWRLAAAIAAICLAPGCATSAGDAAPAAAAMPAAQAPAIAATQTTPSVISEVQLSSGEPRNTGAFPNLNIPPQSAAEQISAQQKAARLAQLGAARAGQQPPPGAAGSPASNARLRKLASSHAAEALEEIENN
jgi:hypothetical protein